MLKRFKGHGADLTSGTMPAITAAVNFNIFEHALGHFFTSDKALTMDDLHLQAVKEAFSAGIAVAVALPLMLQITCCFPIKSELSHRF